MTSAFKFIGLLILPAVAFAVISVVGVQAAGTRNVIVASRSIEMGEVIQAEDVQVESTTRLDAKAMTDESQVVGMRALRPIGKGNIVKAGHVDDKVSIRKGDMIVLIAKRGNLKLTARGIAVEDGTMGSEVKVENVISGKILNARVIGPGEAVVNF